MASATALVAALVAPASAASQQVTIDRVLTAGPTDLGGTTYIVNSIFDVFDGEITVTAEATIEQPIRESLDYDDAEIRQGSTASVDRSVASSAPGTLSVTWHVTGDYGSFDTSASNGCTISFTSPVSCGVTSSSVRLFGQVPVPLTPFFDLVLQASVSVTPDGALVTSTELAGAVTIGGPADEPEPGTQAVDIPCTVGVGSTLSLSDADYALSTTNESSNGPAINIGVWVPIPIPPFVVEADVTSIDLGPQHEESFAQDLADATTKVSELGQIAANNVPPDADAAILSAPPHLEGVPVQFDASGSTSICGFDSLAFRWDFSDGGVAFGAQPFHTFQDDGVFSGQLTATDPTGLSNVVDFSVTVGNQDPIANAGPDTTADWGRLVTFGGAATDPGADDQSTLEYMWDFDDGSPPVFATGGSVVTHAYALPGVYTATLTVTDKDGGVDTDVRVVTVTKRDTSTGYLGASTGTYDTPTSLSASLVDEYGATINGRSIGFSVDGASAGSATTNSSGIATRAYTPLLVAGSYATGAAFAGDTLYNGSGDAGSIAIAAKGTTVTYTGALNGGPNKTIGLSAILADASGTRLGGRTIVFQLGTQSVQAVTNADGVASVDLKLTQKNGIYPLTATFTPAGADVGRYVGSSDAESFKLQKK